jgi:hypothetical protein
LELEKRMSNYWSGRVSYTYARCFDVASVIVDSNPRLDYGRCDRDNTHALASSATFDLSHGFGAGFVFRTYSGYPINELVGSDANGDNTNNDRPIKGVNDLASPIVSAVDSRGVAVRNGINGERKTILDGRFQYTRRISRYRQDSPGDLQPDEPREFQPTGTRTSATSWCRSWPITRGRRSSVSGSSSRIPHRERPATIVIAGVSGRFR